MTSPRRRAAYLLVIVLALFGVFVAILAGLSAQGGSLSMLVRREADVVKSRIQAEDAEARLGLALYAPDEESSYPLGKVLGNVTARESFRDGDLAVNWGRGNSSLRVEVPRGSASFANLFASPDAVPDDSVVYTRGNDYDGLPYTGYSNPTSTNNGIPVAPGQAGVTLQGLGRGPKVLAYNRMFPYAAYAPQGSVSADNISSWVNPTLSEAADRFSTPEAQSSGVPAWVRAGGAVNVTDFAYGKVFSDQGPITVQGGALGFTAPQPPDEYCAAVRSQVLGAMNALKSGTLDKGCFVGGKFLTAASLFRLFQGDTDVLKSAFSVQQAVQFPFIPLVVMQEDVVVNVLLIYPPAAADFTGESGDGEAAKELAEVLKRIQARQDEIEKQKSIWTTAQQAIAADQKIIADPKAGPAAKEAAGKDKSKQQIIYDKAHGEWQRLEGLQEQDKEAAQNLQDQVAKQQNDVYNGKEGHTPTSAWEDASQETGSGWSYQYVLNCLGDMIKDLVHFDLEHAMTAMVREVRMVHFGGMDPNWNFGDDPSVYNVTGTWTVPRGRTLQLSGRDISIAGDLWIQRGATVYCPGNLNIQKPAQWFDLHGVEVDYRNKDSDPDNLKPEQLDPSTNPFYPWGRVFLEQGATLVVGGNLTVSGGAPDTGGIIVCSRYDCPPRITNTAVLVGGDLNVTYGVYSGGALTDLVWFYAAKDSTTAGLFRYFLDPLFSTAAPNIAKIFGPWERRSPSYFAKFATTFVQFPVLNDLFPGLGELPVPLPLPVDNCLRGVFEKLSRAVSLELNFNLGENLYTQCDWWLMGRGAVPVLLKADPASMGEAFRDVDYEKITLDALKDAASEILSTVIPEIIVGVIKEFVVGVVANILKEEIPFNFPSCPGAKPDEGGDLEKKIKDELVEIVEGEIKRQIRTAFSKIVINIRNEIAAKVGGNEDANYLCREMPGCFFYSGGSLTIGRSPFADVNAITTAGYFFAEKDLYIGAKKIVGSLVSAQGSVTARGQLLYYPFFSQASLYVPPKPGEYPGHDLGPYLAEALQFLIPDPGRNTAIDLGLPAVRMTAAGWQR